MLIGLKSLLLVGVLTLDIGRMTESFRSLGYNYRGDKGGTENMSHSG